LPVLESQGFKLGLVTIVTELFSAVANPAGAEELAAVGADELGIPAGAIRRNEENAFHEILFLVQYAEQWFRKQC